MADQNGPSWPDVELFNAISQKAVEAAGTNVAQRVKIVDLTSVGDRENYLIIDKEGVHSKVRKDPPTRVHWLMSCKDVIAYVELFKSNKPIVWVSDESIIVTHDDDRLRGDSAKYEFRITELFASIQRFSSSQEYTQSDFLRLLRVGFARAFVRDDARLGLIKEVRSLIKREASSIKVGGGSHETGMVNQANESITWPDSILLATAVFDDPSFSTDTHQVEVILDVRPERVPFVLEAVAADLTTAVQETMAAMVEFIKAEVGETPVFLGSPS